MCRIGRIFSCRRIHLRRTFLILLGVAVLVFVVLSWLNYLAAKGQRPTEVLRSVETDYSYYYNIDVDALKRQLPSYATALKEKGDPFTEHFFNKILSDDLPLDRSIPDSRHKQCPLASYRIGREERNSVSVIISYHNEALSTLLRTVISVLHRTPPDLLNEIILVDDYSSEKDFQSILLKLPRTKFLKNDIRLGLIKSRNKAARVAEGSFLFFLDSHSEVNSGWLEPLLDAIVGNKFTISSPLVDIIDPHDLQYKPSSLKLKAGFDWSLRFKWIPRDEEVMELISDRTRPFQSPMTYGGIFLVHKDWFNDLNQFDDALEIWGGESLEMSIKCWLCGGQIAIVPCSRVGHIFRKKYPYSFPRGTASQAMVRNTKRIAESWLDEYKKFYYLERPQALSEDIELDRNATEALKDRLQCRPFSWFLQIVFPELKIPNKQNLAYGELLQGDHQCLQISVGGRLEMIDCFADDHVTTWALQNRTSVLMVTSGGCLTAYPDLSRVGLEFCKTGGDYKAQKWLRSRGNLINVQTKRCLENLGREVGMSDCRNQANTQLWHFTVEIEQQRN